MFEVITLGRLNEGESREAILRPLAEHKSPVRFSPPAVSAITRHSGGYPYFIQFLCREMFDAYLQRAPGGKPNPADIAAQVVRKLDSDFYAGRWNRVTDRQRELLVVVAELPDCDEEFTVQDIVEKSQAILPKPFSASHVTQILGNLAENGLVYRNRHGRYSFALPLLGDFIRRQQATPR